MVHMFFVKETYRMELLNFLPKRKNLMLKIFTSLLILKYIFLLKTTEKSSILCRYCCRYKFYIMLFGLWII